MRKPPAHPKQVRLFKRDDEYLPGGHPDSLEARYYEQVAVDGTPIIGVLFVKQWFLEEKDDVLCVTISKVT